MPSVFLLLTSYKQLSCSVLSEAGISQFMQKSKEKDNINLTQINFLSQMSDSLPCPIDLLWTAVANAVCIAHLQKWRVTFSSHLPFFIFIFCPFPFSGDSYIRGYVLYVVKIFESLHSSFFTCWFSMEINGGCVYSSTGFHISMKSFRKTSWFLTNS